MFWIPKSTCLSVSRQWSSITSDQTNVSLVFFSEPITHRHLHSLLCSFQLPIPIAVFALMYKERLIGCGSGARTRLLERDELAIRARGSTASATPSPQNSTGNGP